MSKEIRPAGVPADAVFVAEWNEWAQGPRDSEGRYTGLWKSWRKDGSFAEDAMFEAGQLHGPKTRYYEDGSLASKTHNERGNAAWLHCFRPGGETGEVHPFNGLNDSVRECRFTYNAAGQICHQATFTAAGVEVSTDGIEMPPRPAGVPADANFMTVLASQTVYMTAVSGDEDVKQTVKVHPERRYWELCAFTVAGGKCVYHGVTRVYALDGTLETLSFGKSWVRVSPPASPDDKLGDGNPLIAAGQAGDQAAVDLLFEFGLHRSPGAALHAAIDGQPALARRIRDGQATGGAFHDWRKAGRPEGIPASAVWVPGLEAFVEGALASDGSADGGFQLWKEPQGDLVHTQITFAQGHRVRQIDTQYPDKGHDEDDNNEGEGEKEEASHTHQAFFTSGPHQGQVRLRRELIGDVVQKETEFAPDQSKVIQRIFEDGRLKCERIGKDGALEIETWWKAGARVAVVVPWDGQVAPQESGYQNFLARMRGEPSDGEMALYRAYEGDVLVAEGLTRAGFKGKPVGLWNVYEDEKLVGEAPFTRLEGLTMARVDKRDAGAFAQKLLHWVHAPTPTWFEDIAQAKVGSGWFSDNFSEDEDEDDEDEDEDGEGEYEDDDQEDDDEDEDDSGGDDREGQDGRERLLPFLLTGLVLGDAEVFDLVMDQLVNDVLHQETLSEASGPVLTTMLRWLPLADLRSQAVLLDFIADVVWCDSSDELAGMPAIGGGDVLHLLGRTPFEAIAAQALAAGKSGTAEIATEIGQWAKARIDEVDNALKSVLDESDPTARFEKLLAVRSLLKPADYERLFDEESDPIVRFWAAHFSNAAHNPRAVGIWRDTLRQVADLEPRFREVPQGQPGLAGYIVRNLANVTNAHPEVREDLPLVIATLDTVPPGSLPWFVQQLLGLAFGQCELPFAADFMALLEALSAARLLDEDAPGPWPGATDYDDNEVDRDGVASSMEEFGLPATQEELDALLVMLRAAPEADVALREFMHEGGGDAEDEDDDDDGDDEDEDDEDDE